MRISQTGSCSAGFTLLELIIVIFIISLLASAVFPAFYGFGERGLKSDARRMASLLRYLNDSAIYTKRAYSLKFDLQEGTIAWEGPDGQKTEGLKSISGLSLQSKGRVKEGQAVVLFGPMGLQENIEIYLRDGDNGITVIFNPASGRAKIVTGERSDEG